MNLAVPGRAARATRAPGRRTAAIALLAAASLLLPAMAGATPSQDDIDQARAAESAAQMSVAQIEVQLATVTAQMDQAVQDAQVAGEAFNEAMVLLQSATATAEQAQKDADTSRKNYEQGRRELASLVQATYRDGGSSLDALTPYLESDGLRQVETKQDTLDTFGSQADAKMQRVAALEQVARIMQDAADKALKAQQDATAAVKARQQEAQAKAEAATALQAQTATQREALVAELAKRQHTTVALVRQKQAADEAARQEAARKEAEARAVRQAAEERRAAEARAAAERAAQQAAQQQPSRGQTRPQTPSTPAAPAPSAPAPSAPAHSAGAAAGAIAAARSLLGSPYVWGGEGPGYDCSGLTTVAYRSQGVRLTHWSVAQYSQGWHVPVGSAQPGDLVFWSSNGSQSGIYHVAMYLGNNMIIEAPTFGIPVRIVSMYSWGNVMPYATRVA